MNLNDSLSRTGNLSIDIVDLLEETGLTEKEVQIYEFLLKRGSAIPSTIARELGQPRGRIYEGMRNLVAKGFARERPTRPILFTPTPLIEVLASAQTRLARHLIAVQQAQSLAAVQDGVETAVPATRPTMMRDVCVISGRRACYAEITRMAETASKFFWIAGGGAFAERLSKMQFFLDVAHAAAARGVDVRIVFPQPVVLSRSLALLDAGRAVPLLHPLSNDVIGPMVLCATELASLEVVSQPDNEAPSRGDDVAIQVADQAFAARLKERLDALFTGHAAVSAVAAVPVYPWLGPNHGSDIFGDAVKRATTELQVLGPAEWGTYLAANWEHQAPACSAAIGRGVRLRAVASKDAAPVAQMKAFQESWDLRVVPRLPMWLTIVDGKDLYVAFPHPSLGGAPQFRHTQEPHEVRFYQGLFEMLWRDAPIAFHNEAAQASDVALTLGAVVPESGS